LKKPLIIVESPTKIKTLKKYLGNEFNIAASAGHIRDLPVKTLGVDIENNFKASYVNIKDKAKIIANLKKLAEDAEDIYLAPDPDREGEAIAFHIMDILKSKTRTFHRVLIHELTKKGIEEALQHTQKPDAQHLSKCELSTFAKLLRLGIIIRTYWSCGRTSLHLG